MCINIKYKNNRKFDLIWIILHPKGYPWTRIYGDLYYLLYTISPYKIACKRSSVDYITMGLFLRMEFS